MRSTGLRRGSAEDELVQELERRLRAEQDIVPLIGPTSCEGLKRDLRRFLVAKNCDLDAAFAKASTYYRWSVNERPDLIGAEEIGAELDSGKLLFMCDDKDGRPVFLVRPALHYAPSHERGFPRKSTEQLLVAAIRYAVSRMPSDCERICIVADMRGFTLDNRDTGVLRGLGGLLAKYFPGRFHKMYVINPPSVLWAVWSVIKPLVSKKWLAMIQFCACPTELLSVIDQAELPMEFGGQIVPDWSAWASGSKAGILSSRKVNLHAYCRRGNGEVVLDDEIAALRAAAQAVSELNVQESDSESFLSCDGCSDSSCVEFS